MGWKVHFYSTKVEKAIQKWPPGIKAKFSWIVELIEAFGIQKVGMPYIKALGNGLFEIRAKGKEGIGRALFCMVVNEKVIVLNGFIKKTQCTPDREMELALIRQKEVMRNG